MILILVGFWAITIIGIAKRMAIDKNMFFKDAFNITLLKNKSTTLICHCIICE
jgi:hypothetical protein